MSARRSCPRWGTLALAAAIGGPAVAQDEPPLAIDEPRAFGHSVGDVVTRRITLRMPASLRLDESTLPQPGRRGSALELRAVRWSRAGERIEIGLDYQVFLAPREVRMLEMPPFHLRFDGAPRPQEVRIDAWPVVVAPLAPAEASPRHGLGELRPDIAPPAIDTWAVRARLAAYAVVAALGLGYLGWVYLAWPRWLRRQRPFAQAWAEVRGLTPASSAEQVRAAMRAVHEALNRSAGEVLFEPGVDRFVAAEPRYAALREDLRGFFGRSRAAFFGADAEAARDAAWLIAFCRRCRDAERGAA